MFNKHNQKEPTCLSLGKDDIIFRTKKGEIGLTEMLNDINSRTTYASIIGLTGLFVSVVMASMFFSFNNFKETQEKQIEMQNKQIEMQNKKIEEQNKMLYELIKK